MFISFDELGPRITKEDILERVSEEAIYKRFCPKFPDRCFPSPWRKDRNPSFGFYRKNGHWRWKDMAYGDGGDVWTFVATDQKTDFQGALKIIADAFGITTETMTPMIVRNKFSQSALDKAGEKQRSLIQVVRRDFTRWDYEWWNRILIHPGLLRWYQVGAGKEVWCDKKLFWFNKEDNPIYYYLSSLSSNIKCYRPLEPDKRRKWLSNQDPLRDIQGYAQCNIKQVPGQPLILTKALKECMFFRAFGINAMANTAESTHFHPDFIRHIKKYCGPIITLYDNDEAGIKNAMKLRKDYGFQPVFVCSQWGAKDPTDLWLANYRKVYDLLNLIYEYFTILRTSGSAEAPRELRAA